MTDRTRYRWATVKVVGRASCSGSETDVMVLDPGSEFFRYMKNQGGPGAKAPK